MRDLFLKISIILIVLMVPSFLIAETDIVVVIDRSGSIKNNMPVIKEYVLKSLFGKVALSEDNVHLFVFAGNLEFIGKYKGSVEKTSIMADLEKIIPNGSHTDLTRAVEHMRYYIQNETDSETPKLIFFLTDGVNDPPPDSPFRSGLRHRFFKEAEKNAREGGWTVFVTGIGSETDAEEVSTLIGADYVELSGNPSLQEFDDKITSRLQKAKSSNIGWYIAGGILIVVIIAGGSFTVLKVLRII